MQFLLIGSEEDPHITCLQSLLETAGQEVITWSSSHVPFECSPAISITDEGCGSFLGGLEIVPDLVWFRKRVRPDVACVHPDDRPFLEGECNSLIDGFLFVMEQRTTMINRASRARHAASKILQLHTAVQHGFPVPQTIITNDPSTLRAFWHARDGALIFKPLTKSYVEVNGELLVLPTTILDRDKVYDDELISGAPALYQQIINKAEEVRITVFGDELVAAGVYGSGSDEIDWRLLFGTKDLHPVTPPPKVVSLCRKMLSSFQLEAASFDFAVDADGSWCFLEMNEAGNFTFVDLKLPEMHLARRFSEFLMRRASGAEPSRA